MLCSMMDREQKETEKRAVGHRVTKARVAAGLSVAEVARRAGLPRQYIYDLEGGVRVSIANVAGAAKALGLSVDFLLGFTEHSEGCCTHSCCAVSADRDAWLRFGGASGRWLTQQPDGSFKMYEGNKQTIKSIMLDVHGRAVELLRCGLYRWNGVLYTVGGQGDEPATDQEERKRADVDADQDDGWGRLP